jgi:hypothetical protein
MSKPKITLAILFAIVIAVGFVVSSSGFVISALAQRGGGQSNNGCGLTGESGAATFNGQQLGQGTAEGARTFGGIGGFISGGASGCSQR